MGFHETIGIVIEETPVGGVSVPAFLGDAIDGIRRALVVIAPGLPGMVDGGKTPVLTVAFIVVGGEGPQQTLEMFCCGGCGLAQKS
jgi:hypothetical protein